MIGWLWRYVYTALLLGEQPCRAPRCGRQTVGFTTWCWYHADEILMHTSPPPTEAGG